MTEINGRSIGVFKLAQKYVKDGVIQPYPVRYSVGGEVAHSFERVKDGWQCRQCEWTWKGEQFPKLSMSCPNIKRYDPATIPANLRTALELQALRVPRDERGPVAGCYFSPDWFTFIWLYEYVELAAIAA